jgi:UDP-N-acetyl-D-mannosaminuronic acid transferase (WecB/TagA/CpsF family)
VSKNVLGMRVDATSYEDASQRVVRWAQQGRAAYVCVASVHMGMEAFDFHTGRVRQAPRWMQAAGLEWVFRLVMDPRRLRKRYAKHNPRFVGLLALQLLGLRRSGENRGQRPGRTTSGKVVESDTATQTPVSEAWMG